MRKRAISAAIAVVLVLAGGVTACSNQKRRTPTSPAALVSSPPAEPLTPALATAAFQAYVANDDVARASADERLALSRAVDGQSKLLAAQFRQAAFTGDPVPRYDYGTPTLYVPRLTQYPQWFVASVDRTVKGDPKSKRATLMAFTLKQPGATWNLSLVTEYLPKVRAPRAAVDKDGYATPLATFDTGLTIRPRDVPAIQASIAEEGPEVEGATVMKPGPATTGYFDQANREKKSAKDAGLAYDTVFVATEFPIFALRTVDGGALVLYALSRDTTMYLKNKKKGRLTVVPRDAAHLLDSMILGDQLNTTETLQFAALDPAKVKGRKPPLKAEVIAGAGAVTKASSPTSKAP